MPPSRPGRGRCFIRVPWESVNFKICSHPRTCDESRWTHGGPQFGGLGVRHPVSRGCGNTQKMKNGGGLESDTGNITDEVPGEEISPQHLKPLNQNNRVDHT